MNTTRRGFIAALCAPALAAVGCKPKAQTSRIFCEIPIALNISDWEFACLRPGDRVEQRFLVGRFVGGEAHYAEEMRVREVGFRDDGWPELKAVPNHFYNIGKRSIR